MKLLAVCPEYLPFPGGAEKTLHEILLALRGDASALEVLTLADEVGARTTSVDGIEVRRVSVAEYFGEVERAASSADIILLQQLFVFRTIKNVAIDRVLLPFIDKIVYVASVDPNLLGDCVAAPLTICCSDWLVRQLPPETNRVRLYPLMSLAARAAPSPRSAITIVNPDRMKGGDVFREIVSRMPDERFVVQLGRSVPVRGLDFANVEVVAPVSDMMGLYGRTDVLLMPSTCPETFGRVALEAAMAGCLVLCHRIAGMAELPLPEECFVDGLAPDTWVSRIAALRRMPASERATLHGRIAREVAAFDPGWAAARAKILEIAKSRAPRAPSTVPLQPASFETIERCMDHVRERLRAKRPFLRFIEGAHRWTITDGDTPPSEWWLLVRSDGVDLVRAYDGEPSTHTTMTARDFESCAKGEDCFEYIMNLRSEPRRVRFDGPRAMGNRLSLLWTELRPLDPSAMENA